MTPQASLFDAPVIDPTPPRSPVRRTDPDTSQQTARANRSGRQSQRTLLLAAYARTSSVGGDGLTDEEAGDVVGLDHVQATRRVSELKAHGWLEDTGMTRELRSGCQGRVLSITKAGWAVVASRESDSA